MTDMKGEFLGFMVLFGHSIGAGMFVSVYYACLSKNISTHLAAIGISISITMNDIAIFIGPLITGKIMGEKATKETINQCCWFLAGVGFLGMVFSGWLVSTDR